MISTDELLRELKDHINRLNSRWEAHRLLLDGNGRRPLAERLGRLEWATFGMCGLLVAAVAGLGVNMALGFLGYLT